MSNYPDLEKETHKCEDKGCQERANSKLEFSVNGEYFSSNYCLRHYYEHHYRIYKKCCVDDCTGRIYKQFLTPPENPYAPALGPYLCKEHFNELKNKCIIADCHEPATVKRIGYIQSQKVTYYLCEAHADDQDTLKEADSFQCSLQRFVRLRGQFDCRAAI